ncbi:hypothetical protein ES703_89640 [subsurface metagenome]
MGIHIPGILDQDLFGPLDDLLILSGLQVFSHRFHDPGIDKAPDHEKGNETHQTADDYYQNDCPRHSTTN